MSDQSNIPQSHDAESWVDPHYVCEHYVLQSPAGKIDALKSLNLLRARSAQILIGVTVLDR